MRLIEVSAKLASTARVRVVLFSIMCDFYSMIATHRALHCSTAPLLRSLTHLTHSPAQMPFFRCLQPQPPPLLLPHHGTITLRPYQLSPLLQPPPCLEHQVYTLDLSGMPMLLHLTLSGPE